MRKRARESSADVQNKDEILVDWVSRLPDDVLVNIISRLTLEEAGRTSVLSTRWKYVWTFTASLNFDTPLMQPGENLEEKRSKYINWVNKVLESHRGLTVNEFKICFHLDHSHESIITNWIYTAMMSKRVENFELMLPPIRTEKRSHSREMYTFPREFYNSLKNLSGLSSLKSLRYLTFDSVNVTREILEFFILNCPLEQLRLSSCKNFLSLKVAGLLNQLKYLAIYNCKDMEEVEISAPSLVSFAYFGPEIKLHIENVPELVDVTIGGRRMVQGSHFFGSIISYFSQLKNLKLGFTLDQVYVLFSQRELPQLRNLFLKVSPSNSENLLMLAHVTKACPLLENLRLQLHKNLLGVARQMHPITNYPIQHLKVLQLVEFIGHAGDIEFASYFVKNATMLEKVIIRPYFRRSGDITEECTKLLEPMLPQGVRLVTNYFY